MSKSDPFKSYRKRGYVICRLKTPAKITLTYTHGVNDVSVVVDRALEFDCLVPLTQAMINDLGEENVQRES